MKSSFPRGFCSLRHSNINAVDAVNYGAIGVVIGHEISHGFDDEGAQFDFLGRLRNWWTDADLEELPGSRGACVADQFDNYYIEKDIHHNGKLVLGESIRRSWRREDCLPGIRKIAWRASRVRRTWIGFTPEQQFFIAWGQFRGDEIRPEAQRLMVQSDPHPIAKYRVIGPLSNLPEFQRLELQGRCADGASRRQKVRGVVRRHSAVSFHFTALFPGCSCARALARAEFGGTVPVERRAEPSPQLHRAHWHKIRGNPRARFRSCAILPRCA